MTGQGEGRAQYPGGGTIAVEVRSVNHRHLKISLRTAAGLGGIEPAIESQIRSQLHRGSVQVNVHWIGRTTLDLYHIQLPVVQSYIRQCQNVGEQLGFEPTIQWSELVNLPGVITEAMEHREECPELEQCVLHAVSEALNDLQRMRASEGGAMARELQRLIGAMEQALDNIQQRAPHVLAEYRQRLKQRVIKVLADAAVGSDAAAGDTAAAVTVSDSDLLRELVLISDKSDIREEIVRLRSHFQQFSDLLVSSESQGRRLDFLIQEMFRESNTIGSKAADAHIARQVVELKTLMEQARELVQNVE
ncbi:MAG: YicC family protein [Pirellulaceae bacterium]|nr:YicC family protein [Pirellulaceae bacterium]